MLILKKSDLSIFPVMPPSKFIAPPDRLEEEFVIDIFERRILVGSLLVLIYILDKPLNPNMLMSLRVTEIISRK